MKNVHRLNEFIYVYGDNDEVILSNDPELATFGVQELPEDVIQYLVENPSCEWVEVEKGLFNSMGRQVDPMNVAQNQSSCIWKYIVNIPLAEKPKQECRWSDVEQGCVRDVCKCEQKQHLIDMMKADEEVNIYSESVENKLKALVEHWKKRQILYENLTQKYKASEHTCKKFTYKAIATRDCWKELLKLIEDEK